MAFRNFLQSTISAVISPTNRTMTATSPTAGLDEKCTVIELNGINNRNMVAAYGIQARAESLILYGPLMPDLSPVQYNIILHVPQSERMFSLYRTNDGLDAEVWFVKLKDALVPLVRIDSGICHKSSLDNVNRELIYNAGWNPAHLAVAMDWAQYIGHGSMRQFINAQDEGDERKVPLHVAIKYKNYRSVVELINAGAQLNIPDARGNTVFHEAVHGPDRHVQILETLLTESEVRHPELKDVMNDSGCTPLHLACAKNCQLLIEALLRGGANVNIAHRAMFPIHIAVQQRDSCSVKEIVSIHRDQLFAKDLEEGGTPLHWAQSADLVGLLLDLGCDPNIPNAKGKLPLHIAVERRELKSVVKLLCHKSFPDMKDADGDTPLHIAARSCSRHIIQALIVFGANMRILNKDGLSVRHVLCTSGHADWEKTLFYLDKVGAERCLPPSSPHLQRCSRGCSHSDSFNGIPPPNFPLEVPVDVLSEALRAFAISSNISRTAGEETTGGRILCLDGGGIRGLVLTQCLLVIEEHIGRPITDLFDWIAGTSTGGILTLGLACEKSVLDLQSLYMRFKDVVFTGGRPYDSHVLEDFLKKEFGEEKKMNNIRRPRVMVTATTADTRPVEFHMFRNYMSPESIINQSSVPDPCLETEVWKVAKWTGAAPSYFKLDGSKYIDGGLIANNPTLDALTEITKLRAALKAVGDFPAKDVGLPSVVVSLGCGIQPSEPIDVAHLDIAVPKRLFDIVGMIGVVPRLQACLNLLVDQATQSEGQVVERSRTWCSTVGIPYFRFSPDLPVFVDLDETRDEILVDLMWVTRAKMLLQKNQLEELRQILLKPEQF